jgi:hypothetical protein
MIGKNPCGAGEHRLFFATLLTAAPNAFGAVQSHNLEAKMALQWRQWVGSSVGRAAAF